MSRTRGVHIAWTPFRTTSRASQAAPHHQPLHIRFGTIADEIAAVARERAATLVVVGASPHQRLNRIIGGERAVQVLRSWSCPVLSVPPGFAALPKKIVVAVDFAPASMRAAQLALSMLADGGTLTLVHVLPPVAGDMPLRGSAGHNIVDDVRSLFSQLGDELRAHGTPARDDRDEREAGRSGGGHRAVRPEPRC
jgi:nucleotide-binding universal stress UspA family protein